MDIEEIEVDYDLYNIIPTDEWNITNNPNDVVVIGSLEDDVQAIDDLQSLPNDMFCSYVDFDRVATILRAIGEYENPPG